MRQKIIIVLLLACTQAVAWPRARLDYMTEVKNPERRLPILAEARQLLREAKASETNRVKTLTLGLNRCEQLLWVRPDDVFVEALVILAEITWLKGQPDRALEILKEYDKIIRMSGLSSAKKGVSFSDRIDYQTEMLRGRIHEQKGIAALQAKDQETVRDALTESGSYFASAASLAGCGVDSPAAHKVAEVKRLIPIVRILPHGIQTNTANQALQDTSLSVDSDHQR